MYYFLNNIAVDKVVYQTVYQNKYDFVCYWNVL